MSPRGRHPFVPRFLQCLVLFHRPRNTYRPQRKNWPTITNKAQTSAMIAIGLAKNGPVLVFCTQRQHVRQVVKNIIESLEYLQASNVLPTEMLGLPT